MVLGHACILPQPTHRFLGIMLDQELRWKQQADSALARATKWTLAFQRPAKSFSGVNLRLMRQLYRAVAIPKILYAVDVWYTPIHKKHGAHKSSGSVGTTNKFISFQRTAALAITGALRSTATDVLDLHAGLLPMTLVLCQACHRAVL